MHYACKMNFSLFLKRLKLMNNLKSTKDLYESLGSEKMLKVKYRQFVQVENGTAKPNIEILLAAFGYSVPSEHNTLIASYFDTLLEDVEIDSKEKLLEYLKVCLNPGLGSHQDKTRNKKRQLDIISEEKLKLLNGDNVCLRLHEKVVLFEKLSVKELSTEELRVVPKLINADIIKREGSFIKPLFANYRLPTKDNSPLRAVSEGNKYILNLLNNFISYEDDESQELSYATGLFEPEVANKIKEQMITFKKWIQSEVSEKNYDHLVPMIYIAFGKKLKKQQI